MDGYIEILEFELGKEEYALDIHLVREIVEMKPITEIPRTPPYIRGIMNLRGEITTILSLNDLLSIPDKTNGEQKIIVLVPEASQGSNVGMIVDDVHSVMHVPESDIDLSQDGLGDEVADYLRGIIRIRKEGEEEEVARLVLWLDMNRLLDSFFADAQRA
ncbi:MAG: purine-binding chemotaxis protein CheW [Methanocalculus sp. MSAO_Arc1]|uniref:chemotaxis protein CheW n=1 Tax=Methanocalculus TaxID=71151 RepID=UPI000FF846C5|nr:MULTISPECIES: chemotaxis protein CheW [unclassified Methanocalculus]MCP1661620.1 purine-binding chemotaxis protein CheW [Methanocalculus sp. AMF5]RQD79322.1 MAG: purine-binding chemotaxis protein CheW [Methanocalculus sp. MSAO_Arc1]